MGSRWWIVVNTGVLTAIHHLRRAPFPAVKPAGAKDLLYRLAPLYPPEGYGGDYFPIKQLPYDISDSMAFE
jgi:hypothetical protein